MADKAGILKSPDAEWSLVWVSLSDTELKKKKTHQESLLCFSLLFPMLAVAKVSIAYLNTCLIKYADRMFESVCVLMSTSFTLNFMFRDWLSVCSVFQTLSCWRKPAWPKESWAALSGNYTWPLTYDTLRMCVMMMMRVCLFHVSRRPSSDSSSSVSSLLQRNSQLKKTTGEVLTHLLRITCTSPLRHMCDSHANLS